MLDDVRNIHLTMLICVLWVGISEAITVFHDPRLGVWLHIVLFVWLVLRSVREKSRPLARVWLVLTFAPLIRIVSLGIPLKNFRLLYWYVLTGIPLAIMTLVILRYYHLPRERFALRIHWSARQFIFGASGLAIGYIEYLILRPSPLVTEPSLMAVLEGLLILFIFTGLVEEIIFRGLMQHAVSWVLGQAGIIYVAVIFTVLHLGYKSFADVIFVALVALYFGYFVHRTQSILGVTLAHGLTNVALFLIFPFLIGGTTQSKGDIQKGPLSPVIQTTIPTPTPFLPQTPTPFQPNQPTAHPTATQTPLMDANSHQPELAGGLDSGDVLSTSPFSKASLSCTRLFPGTLATTMNLCVFLDCW